MLTWNVTYHCKKGQRAAFYEALCALGMQSDVLGEIRSYWGGMLELGATSFWELYNPDEKGDAHYARYGRRSRT